MCRPIESRESLGGILPAAVLFAGYPPPGTKSFVPPTALTNGIKSQPPAANVMGLRPMTSSWGNAPTTNSVGSTSGSSRSMNAFGAPNDALHLNGMSAPPPSLPFLSTPKTMSTMPWMQPNAPSDDFYLQSSPAAPTNLKEDQTDALPAALTTDRLSQQQKQIDASELEDLLEFSMAEDAATIQQDKEELVNLDDGFNGTEMSILYSFLVDSPEDVVKKQRADSEDDDGILKLNMSNPIDSLLDVLDEGLTDDELKLPAAVAVKQQFPAAAGPKVPKLGEGETKSRRLCKSEGCYKRSRSNGLCISHGGGRRCAVEGCDKSSQGGNLCIRHGGGKRCSHEGCDKAAQSNFLCKAHGGGPRCQFPNCKRSSQGGGFCRSHGGGKRCMFEGCTKGTQRGDFCALHGGSRLCEVPGCPRNDRGGGLCATHGGGKRCTIDGCGKPCRRKGLCSAHLRQMENAAKN